VVLITRAALEDGAVLDGAGIGRISDTGFWDYFLASKKKPFIPIAMPL
jgi:hypothetical protein